MSKKVKTIIDDIIEREANSNQSGENITVTSEQKIDYDRLSVSGKSKKKFNLGKKIGISSAIVAGLFAIVIFAGFFYLYYLLGYIEKEEITDSTESADYGINGESQNKSSSTSASVSVSKNADPSAESNSDTTSKAEYNPLANLPYYYKNAKRNIYTLMKNDDLGLCSAYMDF